ncbi:MAG TPA: hypothetical protein VGR06_22480 [Actinophytocola sp.]|jgi:hypothetical protein|uniref:hypothetical protein n=1 Tax=Actinophytocola sp. TaxID=1872138 RepID=UPI002E01B9EB|nr:hypothetical protein [Actinophytocola sp.]
MTRMKQPVGSEALQGTTPFENLIDSSVEWGGGIWLTSGKWSAKISKDGKTVMEHGRPFKCPGRWRALERKFSDHVDSIAWTPALGKQEGFWCFSDTDCVRTDTAGDTSLESGTLEERWPKLKGTEFARKIDACVCADYTSDSATFYFFAKGKVITYVRTADPNAHRIEGKIDDVLTRYPRLNSAPAPTGITSVLLMDKVTMFAFRNKMYKYAERSSDDRGPLTNGEMWPAVKSIVCQEDCG